MGVLVPGVATGVVKLEGSSEVKMVAVEGDRTYLAFRVAKRELVNPSHGVSFHRMDDISGATNLLYDFHSLE